MTSSNAHPSRRHLGGDFYLERRDGKAGMIRPSVLGIPWLPLARRALRWE